VATGEQKKAPSNAPSYTKVFANALIREAEDDPKIVAVTAAMPDGTGLDLFGERFPTRTFDVGIAEQHAVTMCAGMAAGGLKPFARSIRPSCSAAMTRSSMTSRSSACRCASPSTARGWWGPMARPMRAASTSPTCRTCRASWSWPPDEAELVHMVRTALEIDDRPSAFRYPRGEGVGVEMPERGEALEIGKGRMIAPRGTASRS
jgi:1-deoxy-D-xylulose-5-phosphate synthase